MRDTLFPVTYVTEQDYLRGEGWIQVAGRYILVNTNVCPLPAGPG